MSSEKELKDPKDNSEKGQKKVDSSNGFNKSEKINAVSDKRKVQTGSEVGKKVVKDKDSSNKTGNIKSDSNYASKGAIHKSSESKFKSDSKSGNKVKSSAKNVLLSSNCYHGVGRRKRSIARSYVTLGTGKITINGIDYIDFFKNKFLYGVILLPLKLLDVQKNYDIKVNVYGGGLSAQADAIKLSISICLSKIKLENRSILKDAGYLTTDSRRVERKKYGHKKARRSFQFSKR